MTGIWCEACEADGPSVATDPEDVGWREVREGWLCPRCVRKEAREEFYSDPFNAAYERARSNGWED